MIRKVIYVDSYPYNLISGLKMDKVKLVRIKVAIEGFFIFRFVSNLISRKSKLRIYYFLAWPKDFFLTRPRLRNKLKKLDKSTKNKKRILFLLGDPARDMMTYSLLMKEMKDDYFMKSINHLSHRPYVQVFKPDLIIISESRSIYMSRATKYARRKLKEVKILTLHGEGAINPAAFEWWSSGYNQDWEMVWGNKPKQILIEYGKKNPEKVLVTGNPRFDYHVNAISEEEFKEIVNIDNDKKRVLLTTNFLIYKGRVVRDFDFDIEKYMQLREEVSEAFTNIAKRHPEIQFLIKLHPSEVDEIYTPMVKRKKLKNTQVYCKELQENIPINYFLPHIDVLIHWSSTTSTEAWMHEKPTISVQLVDMGDLVGEFNKGSFVVKNEEDLEKKIFEFLGDKTIPEEMRNFQLQFIEEWYGPIDGKRTACVAQYIQDIINNKIN